MILLTLAPHRWPYKTLMFSKCFQTVVVRVVYDLFKSQNNEICKFRVELGNFVERICRNAGSKSYSIYYFLCKNNVIGPQIHAAFYVNIF